MRPRLRAGLLFLAAVIGLGLLMVAPADAAKEYARIERVDVEPYFAHLARVRVWLNLMHLEGGMIDGVKPEELILSAGANRFKQVPGMQRFERTGEELDIALVVETAAGNPYTEEEFSAVVADFIAKLPHSARIVIVPYGVHTTSIGPWEDPAKASRRWKKIVPEDETDKPHLLDALDKTLKIFAKLEPLKAATSTRKVIMILSDGVDAESESDVDKMRGHFRKVAKTAADGGIVIDSLGFSLVDNRPPMQNLGELSKKTNGTFRWARERSGFRSALDALGVEMRRELVLTYFIPADQITGKVIKVTCASPLCAEDKKLESAERKAPAPRCAGAACATDGSACIADACVVLNLAATGGGFGGLLLGGLAVLVVGGGAAVFLKRRKSGGVVTKGAKGGSKSGPTTQASPNAPAIPVRRPTLTVLNGPLTGRVFPVTPGLMAGKNPSSGILIADGFSSGQHAQFIVDANGNCSIADMGSTNGTFVNGQRTAYAALTNGATIRIGQTDLRFTQG